jgi:hypothetical protein
MDCSFQGEVIFHWIHVCSDEKGTVTKLQIAKEALRAILDQLQPEDSFGLVEFDESATVLHPLTKWKEIDQKNLLNIIDKIRIRGGTNLTNGKKTSTLLTFEGHQQAAELFASAEEGTNRSNRIFFLTDMEATDSKDGDEIALHIKKESDASIFTTIVCIGTDLPPTVIQKVSKTPGCNYSNVRLELYYAFQYADLLKALPLL